MKCRILVADDSSFFRKMLIQFVQSGGHEVVGEAKDGLDAIRTFKEFNPDIVLLDITMPNMSGKECLSELLKINKNIKVIIISSLNNTNLESDCIKLGAKAFLSKASSESLQNFQQSLLDLISKITNS